MYEIKEVPNFDGYYVDNLGVVFSTKMGFKRVLKPSLNNSGYYQIGLTEDGKRKYFLIHRLVMLVFQGESSLQVNHMNGVKTNNRLDNLEYCTASENVKHAYAMGLNSRKGEKNGKAKLTESQVREIKTELLKPYHGINNDLAELYGVKKIAISKIKTGKTWTHIKI